MGTGITLTFLQRVMPWAGCSPRECFAWGQGSPRPTLLQHPLAFFQRDQNSYADEALPEYVEMCILHLLLHCAFVSVM